VTSRLQCESDGGILVELLDGVRDLFCGVGEESTGGSVGVGVLVVPVAGMDVRRSSWTSAIPDRNTYTVLIS
jgi:hypothetical protein